MIVVTFTPTSLRRASITGPHNKGKDFCGRLAIQQHMITLVGQSFTLLCGAHEVTT